MQATLALPVSVPVPMPTGSLEAYIQTVNRFPILSAEEERALALRFRNDGDLEGARGLVLSHLRLVVALARGYLGYGLPHADLIQEGNIGLMKAVKRFDPDRGVRLVSFAIHWIKAEIHEYILRNWRLVKVATTKAQRKLFFNLRSMKKGLEPLSTSEVERRGARAKFELEVEPVEPIAWAQRDLVDVDLSRQQLLRQWRPVVGEALLGPHQHDAAVVAVLAERLRGPQSRERRADDDDVAQEWRYERGDVR